MDLINYLVNNFTIIKENIGTFIIGWGIFFCMGYAVSVFVHKITDERWKQKYKSLKEDYDSLEADYQTLVAKLDEDDLLVLSAVDYKGKSPLAKKISDAINKK